MDKRLGGGAATLEETAALDAVITAGDGPDLLLPALHALNDRVGWISRPALDEVCRRLDMAPATAFGVASFYGMFSTTPRPRRVVYFCDDVPCRLAGAVERIGDLPPSPDGWAWQRSPCLGQCDRAPASLDTSLGGAQPLPRIGGIGQLRLLGRVNRVDPTDLDAYAASGGLAGLRRARQIGPAAVIAEITASGLIGRGGAAFPAGQKWTAVAAAAEPERYLVCNADEAETGTFKDRVLLEGDPFAILEGMAIAAYACGATRSFLYLRGEYPEAARRLEVATSRFAAREGFDVELRRGAGAYICGEETALFNSIEGKRGEPRSKPPFPTEAGLFGKPTVVNNVETLANVAAIVAEGSDAWRGVGTASSPGTKLFCVSGHVRAPGTYEVPFGTTLRTLIEDLAGGVTGGHRLQAMQCGGAAGTFLGPEDLDLPLTFEDLRARGATIGSGAVVVLDETASLLDVVHRTAEFFAHESCGQCVPCRVGTVRQVELLDRLDDPTSRELLREVGQVMRDASICGLGQTASNAVLSALEELGGLQR
jgi:NADH-quinone oxidoreductase subunit F